MPKALLKHYPKLRIVLALRTRQYRDALRQSQIISKRLDDQWFQMHLDVMGLDNMEAKLFQSVKPSAPLMSEATAFCLLLIDAKKTMSAPLPQVFSNAPK